MYGLHVAILLMCVSHNTRCVDFRELTGSQRDPRFWGVTDFPVTKYMYIYTNNIKKVR